MIATDAMQGLARVLRASGDVPEPRARSAAALVKRLAVLADREPMAILDDAEDLRSTLATLGRWEAPKTAGAIQIPPADYAELCRACEQAVVDSFLVTAGVDRSDEIEALSRRQLRRFLDCLPIPRQEGEYEPLTPPEGK